MLSPFLSSLNMELRISCFLHVQWEMPVKIWPFFWGSQILNNYAEYVLKSFTATKWNLNELLVHGVIDYRMVKRGESKGSSKLKREMSKNLRYIFSKKEKSSMQLYVHIMSRQASLSPLAWPFLLSWPPSSSCWQGLWPADHSHSGHSSPPAVVAEASSVQHLHHQDLMNQSQRQSNRILILYIHKRNTVY